MALLHGLMTPWDYVTLLLVSDHGMVDVNEYISLKSILDTLKIDYILSVGADRGLCGGFNSSINRETFKLVKSLESDGKNVQLMRQRK